MVQLGYALSSEEHGPQALVQNAQRAEQLGFDFLMISDHYHPWVDKQGHSPFVWSVIGGIAQVTKRVRLGTGVTCPMIRIHPAIIAQAAATAALMMDGRFFLGVGTGENLNEHITGERWPPSDVRREMLREAVEVLRQLWQGGSQSYYGAFYTVENARIYSLPAQPPAVMVAASGPKAAELAGEIGDGLISTAPDEEVIAEFTGAGGDGKPRYGQYSVCIAASEQEARRIAHEYWPTAGLKGELSQELPLPAHFEQAAENVSEADVAKSVLCVLDPETHLAKLKEYRDAGFDHVYVHAIGPDQQPFFEFYQREVLPRVKSL